MLAFILRFLILYRILILGGRLVDRVLMTYFFWLAQYNLTSHSSVDSENRPTCTTTNDRCKDRRYRQRRTWPDRKTDPAAAKPVIGQSMKTAVHLHKTLNNILTLTEPKH